MQPARVVRDHIPRTVDVLPTVLSYAKRLGAWSGYQPNGTAFDGHDLKPWVDGAPPSNVPHAVCGAFQKQQNLLTGRYLVTPAGSVGRCSGTDVPCAVNADCPQGTCTDYTQNFCRNSDASHHLIACSTDTPCQQACMVCSSDRRTPCSQNADCAAGTCVQAANDDERLACTCGPRRVKLYVDEAGTTRRMTDLLRDPDEDALGGSAGTQNAASWPLAKHLARCLDNWWQPPESGFPTCNNQPGSCTATCDARVACKL